MPVEFLLVRNRRLLQRWQLMLCRLNAEPWEPHYLDVFVVVAVIGFALVIVYSFLSILMVPPNIADVLRVQMPVIYEWSRIGRISYVPLADFRINLYPHSIELLMAWSYTFGGERLAAAVNTIIGGLLWPTVLYCAVRLTRLERRTALLIALVAFMGPAVVTQMRAERVDLGFAAFSAAALLLAVGQDKIARRWWIPLGLSAGTGLGAKTTGVIAIPLIFLGGLVVQSSPGRASTAAFVKLPRDGLGFLCLSGFIALIVGGWTYAQNAIRFGNPVYPFPYQSGISSAFPGPVGDSAEDDAAILTAYRQPESEALIYPAPKDFFSRLLSIPSEGISYSADSGLA